MNSGRTILTGLTMILAATTAACAGSAPKAAVANESPSAPARDYGPSGAPAQAAPASPGYYGGGEGAVGQSAPPPPSAASKSSGDDRSAGAARRSESVAPAPQERPGLGTEWGETRRSSITTVPFVRADGSSQGSSAPAKVGIIPACAIFFGRIAPETEFLHYLY